MSSEGRKYFRCQNLIRLPLAFPYNFPGFLLGRVVLAMLYVKAFTEIKLSFYTETGFIIK